MTMLAIIVYHTGALVLKAVFKQYSVGAFAFREHETPAAVTPLQKLASALTFRIAFWVILAAKAWSISTYYPTFLKMYLAVAYIISST
jgi:hypothetical protein